MNHYIIKYTPPRNTFIDDSTPAEDKIIENHFVYLQQLLENDKLVLAGRTDDAEFGIAIIEAVNETEANKIMNNDPAVLGNVFKAELKLFRVALQK